MERDKYIKLLGLNCAVKMGTQAAASDSEFNSLHFEKTLTSLKDSQDSINNCCQWCLQNRQHHKKIVVSWLNVLKRVKVEQRLVLFYLANDVVQYSKRRNYEYVESWGTALQKATTLVRDDRVKHKILRIFKIWEQRGVYGEEFITDLCGLISVQPTGSKNDEPHEFQSSYVINKIKNCANLERDTDGKLKILKEHNPKIQINEGLTASLKDRAHVDDVEKEVDVYVKHMENYINALKLEIKNRIALISVLRQAETQLESDRKDVKLVAHAYKTFGQRVKAFQKKLEEHMVGLPSPIPSPDINAPSPSPDSDLDLPEDPAVTTNNSTENSDTDVKATVQYTNAGYYTPVPPPSSTVNSTISSATTANDSNGSFMSNGFSSFLGSNLSFDLQNLNTSSLFSTSMLENTNDNTQTTNSYVTTPTPIAQPPAPVEARSVDLTNTSDVYNPLLPPPMPPFSKNNDTGYATLSFSSGTDVTTTNFGTTYQPLTTTYSEAVYTSDSGMPNMTDTSTNYDYLLQTGTNPYPPTPEDYDPTDIPATWDIVENPPWNDLKETDTPESPPMFEKEGMEMSRNSYGDPVEYHDASLQSGAADVDHRVLPGMGDLEDSLSSLGGKDVDHRNLISLTGSPSEHSTNPLSPASKPKSTLKTITPADDLWDNTDQDYRNFLPPHSSPAQTSPPLPAARPNADQDYRLQFNLDNLNVPPPPPPLPKSPEKGVNPPLPPVAAQTGDLKAAAANKNSKIPKKPDSADNVDMDFSDEDVENRLKAAAGLLEGDGNFSLEPPPPFPDLLDDVDANQFLDEISNDLSEFSNLSSELNQQKENVQNSNRWQHPPPLGPPPMNFSMAPPPSAAMMGGMDNMNRMDMGNPPLGLLPSPLHDGPMHHPMNPPMAPLLPPPQGNWMGEQPPPWVAQHNAPPFEENPYLVEGEENPFLNNEMEPNNFVNFGFRNPRGGHNNFRGGFNGNNVVIAKMDGFNDNFANRGRGRGRGPRGNRGRGEMWGGRGGMRGGRGGSGQFRAKGFMWDR